MMSLEYNMLINIHSLEKGLTIGTKFFGEKKALELLENVNILIGVSDYEWICSLAINTLDAYTKYLEDNKLNSNEIYGKLQNNLPKLKQILTYDSNIKGGSINYSPSSNIDFRTYEKFALSRRSVRDFSKKIVAEDEIKEAVSIALLTPSACNRQMINVYIADTSTKKILINKLMGISGFNTENTQFAVITYDLAAFNFEGERNQGYYNAGLFSMNFINALHSKGIGSCLLQWGNNREDTQLIRNLLGIPKSQNITSVLAYGYYRTDYVIPVSTRKAIDSVLHVRT